MRWSIVKVQGQGDELERLLLDGWEPFSVYHPVVDGLDTFYLRKYFHTEENEPHSSARAHPSDMISRPGTLRRSD